MRNLSTLQATITKLAIENPCMGSIQSIRNLHIAVTAICEYLGKGVFRSVYKAIDDDGNAVVIKIVNFKNHSESYSDNQIFNSNRDEWEAFCDIKEHFTELLPMVLAPLARWKVGGHCILVYPFIECIEGFNPIAFESIRAENKEIFDKNYVDLVSSFRDAHDENIGVHEGLPVMIDYNFGPRC